MEPSVRFGSGVQLESRDCEVCHAKVAELRRGRCWGCYTRWAESRAVGLGAQCALCAERRRENLRQVEMLGAWTPMCHNCATKVSRLEPMPASLEEACDRLLRERRVGDRRTGRPDTPIYPRERRGLERRMVGRASGDDLMILDEADIIIIDDGGAPSELCSDGGVARARSHPVKDAAAGFDTARPLRDPATAEPMVRGSGEEVDDREETRILGIASRLSGV